MLRIIPFALFLIISTMVSGSLISKDHIEYIIHDNNKVSAEFVLDYPAEEIWDLITDYERSDAVMPNIEKTTINKKEKNGAVVETTVKQGIFRLTYTSRMNENKCNYMVSWDQIEGPFTRNSGSWKLTPLSAKKTEIFYTIELIHPLMPEWMKKRLVYNSIPDLYTSLNNELGK